MNEGKPWRKNLGEQSTAHGGFITCGFGLAFLGGWVDLELVDADVDFGAELNLTVAIGTLDFGDIRKHHALAKAIHTLTRGVVKAKNDILRRHDGGLAVGWEKHVI